VLPVFKPLKLPPQSSNLNAFAERWVRAAKDECLDQLILFGERSLRPALDEYLAHHQHQRNHQGLDNVIPFPDEPQVVRTGPFANASASADCSIITTAPPPEVLSSHQLYLTRRIVKMTAPCGGHFTPPYPRLLSLRPFLANTHLRPVPI
jgi:hypothetical protein